MAIWPFGRRGKRHTIQLDSDARGDLTVSQGSRHSFDEAKLGRKPSRKQSKRRKNRHSQPVEDYPTNLHDVTAPTTRNPPSVSQSERQRPTKAKTFHSFPANPDSQPLSRNPSLRKPAVLKKKLSKRKAYEIAREREIRMMSSMPIDIPRRNFTPVSGDSMQIDGHGMNRRLDRHRSDVSLSMQDSANSSLSDFSETYNFKVNAFSAWTPRPVIRYVEAPRTSDSRNQKSPEPTGRRTKSPTLEPSEENLRSQKRIDELADDLDAGALRELMERDRRRRERDQIKDQEKLLRRLQRNARKVPKAEGAVASPEAPDVQTETPSVNQRNRVSSEIHTESQPTAQETEEFLAGETQGSWLRDTSRNPQREGCESPESAHVIGTIDGSSIRERKAGQHLSFGPSQDMAMSRSTLSNSIAPSRHGLGSPDSSQFYNTTRESVSDLSRNPDSERRLSVHSATRVNPITSIFRRGSSRLKRRYRDRFPDRSPPPMKNVSHESFFKVITPQQQTPAPYVPPTALLGSSAFKRSQSKFTEHFGDDPLSPPDSRLQSPNIPEDRPLVEDQVPDLHTGSYYPIPGTDGQDGSKNRHRSWTGDTLEEDPDDLPLSQSLASIDSEGSWMSGQYLRRISQKPSNSARQSLSSSRYKPDEGFEKSKCDESSRDAQFVAFGAFPGEVVEDSGNTPTDDQNKDIALPNSVPPSEETWHHDFAKRPVLVNPNPAMRPKSTEGLLKNVLEEEFSPIEEHSAEILFSSAHDTATNARTHQ
ncbi:hypothetical protein BJX99DRAFT_238501 [Aspergillus californicus]